MIAVITALLALASGPEVVRLRLVADELPAASRHGPFLYAYNGLNPGPTIRAKLGDTVEVELVNQLDFATTIHWHGVKVPWAMDGITWMQRPIAPGETFTYRFVVSQAGTFWYHPHLDTDRQVDAGLYGALIVEDPNEPRAEEMVWVFDSAEERGEHSASHGHARREERWLVNGAHAPVFSVRGGSVIRARLINASNTGYLALRGPGKLRVIAGDQGLLPALDLQKRVLLAPGDRAELELLPGREDLELVAEPYSLNGGDMHGEHVHVLRLKVEAPRAPSPGLRWPFPGGRVRRDPGYADLIYTFTGSDRWESGMINGERFPDVTVEAVALGSEAIIELRNVSSSEHPFHLHGVSFEVLSVNGVPPPARTIEDTYNLRIRDRVRVLLRADNPGDWMLHCHILPHAEHGMMTVLRIQ